MKDRLGSDGIEFINYKYGYFSVIAFILPFFRWLVVRRFRKEFVSICKRQRRSRIDLIGHSFGTHVVAWCIQGLRADLDIKIHTVILSGSVLRAGFPWRDLLGRRVKRVINDCGTRDNVLLLSQFFVLFTGMAGRTGFAGSTSDIFRNRYSPFGHSGYFQSKKGKSTDYYMKVHWLPLLVADDPIVRFDRRRPHWGDGIVAVLANNAEPIKVAVYAAPFVLLSWWILGLYFAADVQRRIAQVERDVAEERRITALAHLATAERLKKNFDTAVRLSVLAGRLDLKLGDRRPERSLPRAVLAATTLQSDNRRTIQASTPVRYADFNKDQSTILALSGGNVVQILSSSDGKLLLELKGHQDEVITARFSADASKIFTVSKDNTARIWDANSGRELKSFKNKTLFAGITPLFSPDGSKILASSDQEITLWDVTSSPKPIKKIRVDLRPTLAAISADGTRVAVMGLADAVYVFDSISGQQVMKAWKGDCIGAENYEATSIAISPDGKRVVTTAIHRTAVLYEVADGKRTPLCGHEGSVNSASFSADGSKLVTSSSDKTARVWDSSTGVNVGIYVGHEARVRSAKFTSDGFRIVTASDDKTVRVWSKQIDSRVLFDSEADPLPRGSMAMAAEGTRLVTVQWSNEGQKSIARVWSLEKQNKLLETSGSRFLPGADQLALNDSGEILAVPTDDNIVRVINTQSGTEILSLVGHTGSVNSIRLSADAKTYITASNDKTVRLWDAKTGKQSVALNVGQKAEDAMISSSLARVVVLEDHGVSLWNSNGRVKISNLIPDCYIAGRKIEISSDGSRVFTTCQSAQAFDLQTGKLIARFHDNVFKFKLNPSGSILATSSSDGVRLWSVASTLQLGILHGRSEQIFSIAFSPDGSRIATGSRDGSARIWDAATGEEIASMSMETWVDHVQFLPNGRDLLTLSKGIRLWDLSLSSLSTDALVDQVCRQILPGISKMSREEMRFAGYADDIPEMDVCAKQTEIR